MGTILMKMAVLLQGHAFCAWTAMDPSGYFFFEKHPLIDFQIGKGRKRDFPRGRAAIFSTQRILRGRDPILSTQRIRGGDLEENRHFIERKLVAHGQIVIFFNGGNVDENRHFI